MGRTEIYYFSGTGNSLHVARELQKRLPKAELIPMIKLLKERSIKPDAEALGFVFPIYLASIPKPVRSFMQRLDPSSARYIFTVATRIGSFTTADMSINRILRKKGKKLDAFALINMASNSPTGLKPGKGDQQWVDKMGSSKVQRMERALLPELDRISAMIQKKEPSPRKRLSYPFRYLTFTVMDPLTRNMKNDIGYYIDDTCIGCGTCERVCPSGKVKLKNNRPIWQTDIPCYYCYACFNFCPQQAILVKNKYTRKDGRYHHPDITLDDIVNQRTRI